MRMRHLPAPLVRPRRRTNHAFRFDTLEARQLLAVGLDALPVNAAVKAIGSIAADSHGNLWSQGGTYGESLFELSPDGSVVDSPSPTPISSYIGVLAPGPDGSMWEGGAGGSGLTRYRDGQAKTYPLPGSVDAITFDASGHLWATSVIHSTDYSINDKMFLSRIDLATGHRDDFSPPVADRQPAGLATLPDGGVAWLDTSGAMLVAAPDGTITATPLKSPIPEVFQTTAGPDGSIWFDTRAAYGTTPEESSTVGKVTAGGDVSLWPLGSHSEVGGLTTGPDGAIWFSQPNRNELGRIDPSGRLTSFPIPPSLAGPESIAPDGASSLVFATSGKTPTIGRVTLGLPDPALSMRSLSVHRVEGDATPVDVARFTTADSTDSPSNFTAAVDLGGPSAVAGTVRSDGSGGFIVSVPSTADVEAGSYISNVTVYDGNTASQAAGIAVIDPLPIAITQGAMEFHTGLVSTGTLGTLHDPASVDLFAYTTTIDWGDGTSTDGRVRPGTAGLGASFDHNVQGSHLYAKPGTYTIHIHATDGPSIGDLSWQVNVTDPQPFVLQPVPVEVGVGEDGVIPVAYFNKPFEDLDLSSYPAQFTAMIDWGDGTASSTAGNMTVFSDIGIVISGEHAYATAGSWTVHVTFSNVNDPTQTTTLDLPATSVVHQFPLSASVSYHFDHGTYIVDDSYVPGDQVSLLTPQVHNAFITFDQNHVAEAGVGANGGNVWRFRYSFTLPGIGYLSYNHEFQTSAISLSSYTNGATGREAFTRPGFTVILAFVDLNLNNGGTLGETVYNVVAVHDAARNIAVQSASVVADVTSRALLAKFDASGSNDVASNYSITGSVSFYGPNGQAGSGTNPTIEPDPSGGFDVWTVASPSDLAVQGQFSFAITRSYNGEAVAHLDETGTVSVTKPPIVNLTPVTAGFSVGKVSRAIVATFTSGDGVTDPVRFHALIGIQGAGSVPGEVTADPAGGFDVWATVYLASWGEVPLQVSVSSTDYNAKTIESDAIVTPAPIAATAIPIEVGYELTGPPPGLGGPPFDGSASGEFATFTSTNPAAKPSDFRATITSSDGGTWHAQVGIDAFHGGFGVEASHKFPAVPSVSKYNLTITIDNVAPDGEIANAATLLDTTTVNAVLPPPPPAPPDFALLPATGVTGMRGSATSGVVATIIDPREGTPSQYAATVDWGDGSTSPGALSLYGAGVVVYASHVYATPGMHAYGVIVQKLGGTPLTTSGLISITQPAPIGVPAGGGSVGGVPSAGGPMTIVSARSIRTKHGSIRVVVTLSGTVDVTKASNSAQYILTEPGAGGSRGVKPKTVRITSVTYDPSTNALTLVPRGSFRRPVAFRVALRGSTGVTALAS